MQILNPEGRTIKASFDPDELNHKGLMELNFKTEARFVNDNIFPIMELGVGSFDKIEFRDADEIMIVLKQINENLSGKELSCCEVQGIKKGLKNIVETLNICGEDDLR